MGFSAVKPPVTRHGRSFCAGLVESASFERLTSSATCGRPSAARTGSAPPTSRHCPGAAGSHQMLSRASGTLSSRFGCGCIAGKQFTLLPSPASVVEYQVQELQVDNEGGLVTGQRVRPWSRSCCRWKSTNGGRAGQCQKVSFRRHLRSSSWFTGRFVEFGGWFPLWGSIIRTGWRRDLISTQIEPCIAIWFLRVYVILPRRHP